MTQELILIPSLLQLFAGDQNTNVTTDSGLTKEMKTFYDKTLIRLAEPELVHDQFAQKRPIPKNGGKTIEFRKYTPLAKQLAPLTEGVTPDGQKLTVSTIEATVKQYGGYITLSDVLLLTAIDNNLLEAITLLSSQAARTLDTITREILAAGTNVQYGTGKIDTRGELSWTSEEENDNLNVLAVRMATRTLKNQNAKKIGGSYVGIIHPDVAFDLMSDPEWKYPHQYKDTSNLYAEEIGEVGGVRFVETTEAKKFAAAPLASDSQTLLVNGASVSNTTTVPFDGGTVEANALIGRFVLIGDTVTKVTANTASQMTVEDNVTASDNAVIYPGEGGASGRDVYATLILGSNAYGVTEISGGGLQTIVKQLGSAGTSDPLDQRATAGWKAMKTAVRLVEEYMVRVETTASVNDHIVN